MRLRFRLTHLFAVVSAIGVVIAISRVVYWNVIAPRTPISWHACDPADVASLKGGRLDVIVVAGNWTATGSVYDVCNILDVPSLRVPAHRGLIDFHYSDITDARTLPKLRQMETTLGISDIWPPYIVILDGRHKAVDVCRVDGDRQAVVANVISAR